MDINVTSLPKVHARRSADTAIDVSVVIVNWNTRDLLRDCIRSIVDQTHRPYEIIIIDNASGDDSLDMVRLEFPNAILLSNSDNRGFAAANNQGITVSSGRYVLLLNPDTVIWENAIDRMVEWCDKRPDVGCAGCQVLESDTRIQRTCFRDPSPLSLLLTEISLHRLLHNWNVFGYAEYNWWDRRTEREVDVVSGMFMLVPRRVVDKVGHLDEDFFVYSEEADWCRRIRQAGYRCVFTPAARILHRDGGSKSTNQVAIKMHVQLLKSKLIYARKHYGIGGRVAARVILLSSMLARWVLFSTISLISESAESRSRRRHAQASVAFLLIGIEPKS